MMIVLVMITMTVTITMMMTMSKSSTNPLFTCNFALSGEILFTVIKD